MAGPVDARGRRRDRGSSFTGSVRRNGEEEATEDLRTSPQQNSAAGLEAPGSRRRPRYFQGELVSLNSCGRSFGRRRPGIYLTLPSLPVRDIWLGGTKHPSLQPGWALLKFTAD
jgi:hypothetical protein